MAHLKEQFTTALKNIEPGHDDKSNAPEAHRQVREALEGDPKLAEFGIDSVLIGSYKRSVSIRRMKDVDVFGRLPDLPAKVTSTEILDRFFRVLHEAFGLDAEGHRRTKRQARSLQVSFPEYDLYVDAVPARPHEDAETWEIPQKGEADAWRRTNPEELTSLSTAMNKEHDEQYVPTVKLIRQTRRAQLGKSKPGGFFLEIATHHAFASGDVAGKDTAEYYASALRGVSIVIDDYVLRGIELKDPTLPDETISVTATKEEFEALRKAFADAAASAEAALNMDHEGHAALKFRALLGKDDDGNWIFPMPPGFDDSGERNASLLTPGDRVVPAGRRTFG